MAPATLDIRIAGTLSAEGPLPYQSYRPVARTLAASLARNSASVVFGLGTLWLGRRLQARFGTWNATLLAGLAFIVVIGVVMALMPPLGSLAANAGETGLLLTETPEAVTDPSGTIVYPGFDADLLYWSGSTPSRRRCCCCGE